MASDLTLQEGMSDVILRVRHDGLSWRMPAHSLILASRSPVFKELLEERTEEEKPTSLSLVDMRPETALAVLKYIYEDEFPTEITADLLMAAKNYKLVTLRDTLETRLKDDLTLLQACQVLEELNTREPASAECCIKKLCFNVLSRHALIVFASDLIMCLGKNTLCTLLACDYLNIPDDAYLFWGIWRWGRKESSMNGRSLLDRDVATYIDDLLVLIRKNSLRNKAGIPPYVFARFNSCKSRRSVYACPADIIKHASSVRPSTTWEDIISPKMSNIDEGPVCIQLSVEKDVILTALSLEMCAYDRSETFIRVIRETDRSELHRQKIEWEMSSMRKFSHRGESECRLESEIIFHTPLFLVPGSIYSIQFLGNFEACHFVWGAYRKRRVKVGNNVIHFHGQGVTTVREIYLIPDVSVTWGRR